MSVNKKTSNAAVWGETGRYPLAIELSKQVFDYLHHLEKLDADETDCLVRHAFVEQKVLGLSWYNNLQNLRNTLIAEQANSNGITSLDTGSGHQISAEKIPSYRLRTLFRKSFVHTWEIARHENRKLGFFNALTPKFTQASYLDQKLSQKESKNIARLRTSSHRLRVETGRYGKLACDITNKVCLSCSTDDMDTLRTLASLPCFEPILEDEHHVLRTCGRYEDIRHNLSDKLKCAIFQDPLELFVTPDITRQLASFIGQIHDRRASSPATTSIY